MGADVSAGLQREGPGQRHAALRYAGAGLANTATDLAVLVALHQGLGIKPLVANVGAFLVAATQGYLINQLWTFRAQNESALSALRWVAYVLTNVVGLLISSAMILWLSDSLGWLVAKLLATVVVFAWGFIVARDWVFRLQEKPR